MDKMYAAEIASITPNGIEFNKYRYTCRRAIKEQWFGCSILIGKTIPILYHPEDISTIILGHTEDGDVCRLVNIVLYEGEKLSEYYEALDCLKIARKKFRKVASKCFPRES